MPNLFIGVLSGTSLNSIDVAAFKFHPTMKVIATSSYPLPDDFKDLCRQITQQGNANASTDLTSVDLVGTLDHQAGELFAAAVLQLMEQHKISPAQVAAIGSHGQTIRHCPNLSRPFSMQIGDPNIIAERTGITTVADFRRRDIAAGGQGAPLAPAFHAAAFNHPEHARAIINIGGIANITLLHNNTTTGFDVGPGNCLLDYWCRTNFDKDYDYNGTIANSGKVIEPLLTAMLADPFFQLPPPKSTGLEYFNAQWLHRMLQQVGLNHTLHATDIQTTLTTLTSTSIANAITAIHANAEVYLCGGGAYNTAIVANMQMQLKKPILSTAKLGLPPELVEAGLFAWLAQQCLLNHPVDLTCVTGTKRAVKLGGVYYA